MMKQKKMQLTPAQQRVADGLLRGIRIGTVLVLRGDAGSGKTTVLEYMHALKGGTRIGMREFMQSLENRHAVAIEESFLNMVEVALATHDLVMVDDLHLVTAVVNRWGYPRAHLLDAALTALIGEAGAFGKKL